MTLLDPSPPEGYTPSLANIHTQVVRVAEGEGGWRFLGFDIHKGVRGWSEPCGGWAACERQIKGCHVAFTQYLRPFMAVSPERKSWVEELFEVVGKDG